MGALQDSKWKESKHFLLHIDNWSILAQIVTPAFVIAGF